MVAHQAVGVAYPSVPSYGVGECRQKCLAVFVIVEDGLPSVAARGDVVKGSGEFDAQWSCHAGRIPPSNATMQDLTPKSATNKVSVKKFPLSGTEYTTTQGQSLPARCINSF